MLAHGRFPNDINSSTAYDCKLGLKFKYAGAPFGWGLLTQQCLKILELGFDARSLSCICGPSCVHKRHALRRGIVA